MVESKVFGVDAAFIFLPKGKRPTFDDTSILDISQWDGSLPRAFFNCVSGYLADNGFIAILHAGEFLHLHDIIEGCADNGMFRIVSSYTVI